MMSLSVVGRRSSWCWALKATLTLLLLVSIMSDQVANSAPAPEQGEEGLKQQQVIVQEDSSTAIKNYANVPEEPMILPPGGSSSPDINQYRLRPDSLDLTGQSKKNEDALNFKLEEENSSDLQFSGQQQTESK